MPYKDPGRQREYVRNWLAKRREEWFADKACVRCGTTSNLQLDHVDAATKVSHRIWSWSQERRDAELAKCQVLCQPCHEKKTKQAGENWNKTNAFRHGSHAMYRTHGCRCDLCKATQAARLRAWRAGRSKPGTDGP
jgi:5-methylcytosine-specific restriction endonuclease McrA